MVTLRFGALWLPIAIIAPFVVALMLNSKYLRWKGAFRVLLFIPYVVPFVGDRADLARHVRRGRLGQPADRRHSGVNMPAWISSPELIYPALILIGVWGIGAAVIINLAGLRSVPTELYDAAKIDGAGAWGQLRHVTIPLMTPIFLYSLVLGIVEVLQYFLVPFVLNNGTGEPGGATFFYNLDIYKQFFTFQNMSYGATLAWILFVVTLLITVGVFWSARRWVYYAAER